MDLILSNQRIAMHSYQVMHLSFSAEVDHMEDNLWALMLTDQSLLQYRHCRFSAGKFYLGTIALSSMQKASQKEF
jgi:hypothetical protein